MATYVSQVRIRYHRISHINQAVTSKVNMNMRRYLIFIQFQPTLFPLFDQNMWRKNQIVNGQDDEPNNSGAGESYAYIQIVNSQDHPQHNQIAFVDCHGGVESLRWIIETYQNIQFDSQQLIQLQLQVNQKGDDLFPLMLI